MFYLREPIGRQCGQLLLPTHRTTEFARGASGALPNPPTVQGASTRNLLQIFSACLRKTIRLEQDCAPIQPSNTHRNKNSKAGRKQTQAIGNTVVLPDNLAILCAFETASCKATAV